MNKKLRWLLQPRYTAFFVVIFGFAAAALAMGYYLLAGIELGLSALFLGLVLLFKNRRRREPAPDEAGAGLYRFQHQS